MVHGARMGPRDGRQRTELADQDERRKRSRGGGGSIKQVIVSCESYCAFFRVLCVHVVVLLRAFGATASSEPPATVPRSSRSPPRTATAQETHTLKQKESREALYTVLHADPSSRAHTPRRLPPRCLSPSRPSQPFTPRPARIVLAPVSAIAHLLHSMTKRTRAAAEFLQVAAKSAGPTTGQAAASTVSASKKARSGSTVTATSAVPNDNYTPESIASFRTLLSECGGLTPPRALTEFQRRVYALTKRIPAGRVSTYKHVAASLSCPRAYRAVGNALRHNPFAPHVPCHRVLASDGTIGGFAGSVGSTTKLVQQKQRMLQAEGIQFDEGDAFRLRKDESYRRQVILEEIDATGIDQNVSDEQLKQI